MHFTPPKSGDIERLGELFWSSSIGQILLVCQNEYYRTVRASYKLPVDARDAYCSSSSCNSLCSSSRARSCICLNTGKKGAKLSQSGLYQRNRRQKPRLLFLCSSVARRVVVCLVRTHPASSLLLQDKARRTPTQTVNSSLFSLMCSTLNPCRASNAAERTNCTNGRDCLLWLSSNLVQNGFVAFR